MPQISSVDGNRQWLDGGSMYGNAPRVVWERWSPPDDKGRIELACRSLLIETNQHKILCEVGIGAFFEPKLAERYGVQTPERHQLRENLEKLGIQESQIDFVILSHLHFDHAGGLLPSYSESKPGKHELLFPNAKYVVGQVALDRAKNPHSRDKASFIPGLVEKLEASGRLLVITEDFHSELPGFTFFESNGHTPGQLHSVFKGSDKTVAFVGDMIPGTAWVHLPITMGYDRFPELLIDEKKEFYERAVAEEWLVFFTHDPRVSACTVKKDERGKYSANAEFPVLEKLQI